ncbi:ABC transporter permease [Agrobacterium tumefaciens]|uniref:ABC transporter permease n=1 Tax=Agrobacterium tumefaciens TaxID=358 RepID=UPI001574A27F|nr:ABC transporter permease [Agrobacterium tumefaciens]WCK69444.1 ABC transporter permease [Agrobacterium tumefaciens]
MTSASLPVIPGQNEAALHRAGRLERFGLTSLAFPGAALILAVIVLPLGVMVYLSFIDKGAFTFENYERLWTTPIYAEVFRMTLSVSLYTTLIVVAIGYPLAYLFVQLPERYQNAALLVVLLPFWTAVLVRTYAWLVLLQNQGVINHALIQMGIIDSPLELSHNLFGALIGMVHIMLPFMVLPLYASMKAIDVDLMAAASNLGATPARAFRDIYFPLSLPGFLSGTLIVFVLCLGFYVTPAVLGGGRVIMAAMRIDANVRLYSSWGAASSLGVVLLLITVILIIVASVIAKKAGQGVLR